MLTVIERDRVFGVAPPADSRKVPDESPGRRACAKRTTSYIMIIRVQIETADVRETPAIFAHILRTFMIKGQIGDHRIWPSTCENFVGMAGFEPTAP